MSDSDEPKKEEEIKPQWVVTNEEREIVSKV